MLKSSLYNLWWFYNRFKTSCFSFQGKIISNEDSKNAQFTKEAFKLEKGQVSDVFETPFGYEIVKVTNKKTEQKSLEDSREEIVNRILADKYLDQVNSLREKSDVQRF